MSVHYVKGSVLDANTKYICHQVNCQGKMNSGIAKAIRDKWPEVYGQYLAQGHNNSWKHMYGYVHIAFPNDENAPMVVNMFAQYDYGYDGRRYTSYDAFWNCLNSMRQNFPEGATIAFPDHIGCCRGGADWEIIRTMIEKILGDKFEVYIYKYEMEGEPNVL